MLNCLIPEQYKEIPVKIRKSALHFLLLGIFAFSTNALAAQNLKYGTLDGNDIYQIEVLGELSLTVSFFVPMNLQPGNRRYGVDVIEEIKENVMSVGFYGKALEGGGVFFIAEHSNDEFGNFVKQQEKADSNAKLLHTEATRFNGFPAIYNVYEIATQNTTSYRMQYLVDYGHTFFNMELQAPDSDKPCMQGLSNPKLAIEHEFTSANVFFDSFNVK
jgi:hypothetical protein